MGDVTVSFRGGRVWLAVGDAEPVDLTPDEARGLAGMMVEIADKNERVMFEAWVSDRPYEMDVSRAPNNPEREAWSGAYRDLAVDLAWEAWKRARHRD